MSGLCCRRLHLRHADTLIDSPFPLPLWGLAWCLYTSWWPSPPPWSLTCRRRSSPVGQTVDSPPCLSASSSPFGTSSPPPAHAAWRSSACTPPPAAPAHAPPRCGCTSSSYSSAPCTLSPPPSRSAHRAGKGRTSPAADAVSRRPGSWGWPWRPKASGRRRIPCGLRHSRRRCWRCPRVTGIHRGGRVAWEGIALGCSRGRCSGFPQRWSLPAERGRRTTGPLADGWTEPSGSEHPGEWTMKPFNARPAVSGTCVTWLQIVV